MAEPMRLDLTVNGQPVSREVLPHVTLLDFLRDELKLKGAKLCCGVGECGACTVIVDGDPVNACLYLAAEARGTNVETVEGLSAGGQLSTVQHSFLKCGGVQCGFCIPGMAMTTEGKHRANLHAADGEERQALAGNGRLCGGCIRMFD